MKTNHLMLRELLSKYQPKNRGFVSKEEFAMIRNTLHLQEMDALALRNLRDFVVLAMGRGNADFDRMSAITYCIDHEISNLGGYV